MFELVQFVIVNYFVVDQVFVFVLFQYLFGVMMFFVVYFVYCCFLWERELILCLVKLVLVMVYFLLDICLLMVVNVYVVNFSLGVDVYSKQLFLIGDQIVYYSGFVIMVGDFNVWSCLCMNVLYCFVCEMLLCQVCFIDD